MTNQKERNIIIVLLVILIIVVISISTMLVSFAARVEKVEIQQQTETVAKESQNEIELVTSNLFEEQVTESTYETVPTENEPDVETQPMYECIPVAVVVENKPTINEMSNEELILYLKTVDGAVQELIDAMSEDWMIQMTVEEFKSFCVLVFAESGGECIEGQIAVAATVINRMLDKQFPDTFFGVMKQPTQFEVVKNGRIVASITNFEELPDKTVEATLRALQGEDPTEELLREKAVELGLDPVKYAEGGALYFYNPKYCKRHPKVEISIGNHNFHKVWKN